MVQPKVFRRRSRFYRAEALTEPIRVPGVNTCHDSSSVSSSMSADSNNPCIHSSNKKPRLESSDKEIREKISEVYLVSDILVSAQHPTIVFANVVAVSPCAHKPHITLSEPHECHIPILYKPMVAKNADTSALYDLLDRSEISPSPVHIISPEASRLNLSSLNAVSCVISSDLSISKEKFSSKHVSSVVEDSHQNSDHFVSKDVSKSAYRLQQRLFVALLIYISVMTLSGTFWSSETEANSVYVTGGGFSGFWFTLGRLQGLLLDSTEQKQLYCYSSGCLALVAALSRYTMEEMWDIAYNVQIQWKYGHISRFDVVTTFVDDLLYGPDRKAINPVGNFTSDLEALSVRLGPVDLASLKVITTMNNGWLRTKTSIRSPESVLELRTMLIQTTWIPFAIGNGLWHNGHMDGAFTTPFHPVTDVSVGLQLDWDLYANVLNVNLGREKVEKFWRKGVALGL